MPTAYKKASQRPSRGLPVQAPTAPACATPLSRQLSVGPTHRARRALTAAPPPSRRRARAARRGRQGRTASPRAAPLGRTRRCPWSPGRPPAARQGFAHREGLRSGWGRGTPGWRARLHGSCTVWPRSSARPRRQHQLRTPQRLRPPPRTDPHAHGRPVPLLPPEPRSRSLACTPRRRGSSPRLLPAARPGLRVRQAQARPRPAAAVYTPCTPGRRRAAPTPN